MSWCDMGSSAHNGYGLFRLEKCFSPSGHLLHVHIHYHYLLVDVSLHSEYTLQLVARFELHAIYRVSSLRLAQCVFALLTLDVTSIQTSLAKEPISIHYTDEEAQNALDCP